MICRNAPSSAGPLPESCRLQLFPEEPRPRRPGRAGGEGARQAGLGAPRAPFSERGAPARRGTPVTERGLGRPRLTAALPGGPRRRRRRRSASGRSGLGRSCRLAAHPLPGAPCSVPTRGCDGEAEAPPPPKSSGRKKRQRPTSASPAPRHPARGGESDLRNHLIGKGHHENQPFLELKGGLCF